MKKGDIVNLDIVGIDFPAKPYGYLENDDRKCFANTNVVPGQKIQARIGKIKNNKIELRDIVIFESSENVAKPFCEKFNSCGGCSFQYLSYEKQAELKANLVYKLIDNVVKTKDYEKLPIVTMDKDKEYRNKMEFSFGNEYKDGPIILGLHKKNSFHDIVNVNECKLMDENFRKIAKFTNDFFSKKEISFYHRLTHIGFLRNLVIRKGEKTRELGVNIVTTSQAENYDIISEYKEKLLNLDLSMELKSIIHTINDNKSDTVKADKEIILYGKRDITEKLFDLNFKISPYSFFQTNSFGVEKLYQEVINNLLLITNKFNEKPIVFDLFSGTGTIGQIVSKYSKEVYGIELIEEAVIKANENALKNGITNAKFIDGDVFEKLREFDKENIKPDILILDPPRSGVGEKTIVKLLEYEVKHIIYVSCNPKTLAEDLKIFEDNSYILKRVVCVDMFGYTPHVETVALLSKLDVDKHIDVEIKLDELDLTSAESKATYAQIKEYILEKFDLKVSTLYIAQIKKKCGIELREHYNKSKKEKQVIPQCTPEKEEAIMDALRHFKMI
ncbi:23S rRNA (uracil(1939)-C(5))-methyltransferase RlmD [Streptobacillus notomytis]|uniref:23S rRNA (uracil(1939)-C(5))-methyltransferase RlmD n=1 Tax=Streptobacillus notomytis TaxID=1712031 RepID=UPI000935AC70|nr:23S rRNA (uracil(1939)-C(5))-methyltransferase RlmD [Streptobacillus notomytis]